MLMCAPLYFSSTLVNLLSATMKIERNRNEGLVGKGVWRTFRGAAGRVLQKSSLDERPHAHASRIALAADGPRRFRAGGLRSSCLRLLLAGLITVVAGTAAAVTPSPHTVNCTWESVADKYGLPPHLLYAIARQESSLNPRVVSAPNKNGSIDIGLMQINSAWLPTLAKRFGIGRSDLFRSCVNLDVGAWVLYENFQTFGYSWRAIGAYNAKSEDKRLAYVKKVYRYVPPELKH